MSEQKQNQFFDVISKLLLERLKVFDNRSLNLATCVEAYQVIFNTLVDVFTNAKVTLTNEAMNYVAQCIYYGIVINGRNELDPNIFTQRAKIENIETKELAFLTMMLKGTDFVVPLLTEIKKRG